MQFINPPTVLGLLSLLATPTSAVVSLGLAQTFGVISATTLTSTGNTVVTGSCGTYPGSEINGFPPGDCTVSSSASGVAAQNAEAACLTAYNDARASGPTTALAYSDLGGHTLTPGVYTFPTSHVSLSGTLVLNGTASPNGQYIFLINTTFGTAVSSLVTLVGGAQACNVYFIVGSSATIGASTALNGNVIAYTSVAVASAASNQGTFCALHGAVTLINNAVSAQTTCTSV